MKKWGLIFGFLIGLFFGFLPEFVLAVPCPEPYSDEECCVGQVKVFDKNGNGSNGATVYRKKGGSFCSKEWISESYGESYIFEESDIVLTCEEKDGELKFVNTRGFYTSQTCLYCADGEGLSAQVTCSGDSNAVGGCTVEYGSDSGGGAGEEKIVAGDSFCFSETEKGICNSSSGKIERTGEKCKDDEYCHSYRNCWGVFGCWSRGAECIKKECITTDSSGLVVSANSGEIKCLNGSRQNCYKGNFSEVEKCSGKCSYDQNNKAECTGDKYNVSECSSIDGVSIGTSYGAGVTRCNSDNTAVYICNKDYVPEFTLLTSCTGETKCGPKINTGEVGCWDKNDIDTEKQTTVTIEISTDGGFMCDSDTGVWTAFGCIPITASGLANKLLPILFGIAGGISFLRMIYGFILMATSSGDEKKFIEAKSVISSAIIGLLVSIFAIFLFRLIFVSILKIPGLS